MLSTLLKSTEIYPVLGTWLNAENSIPFNMAFSSTEKAIDLSNMQAFQQWVDKQCHGKVGYGGYFEKRDVYAQSSVFKNQTKARNIHLGIDLWTAAQTPIYAPIDGVLHSKSDLSDQGNYGGVIILAHQINTHTFYTLYGHLDYSSITAKVGDEISAQSQLGTLGDASQNGGWPPHLHLQAMLQLDGLVGDYPGVCFDHEVDRYKENCPNPSLFFFKEK